MKHLSKRQSLERLRGELDHDYNSFKSFWQDLADYIRPTRARFLVNQNNQGQRQNQKIIDSTAVNAMKTLRSGMVSGATSPKRPWFKLSTGDKEKDNLGPVKQWLFTVESRMRDIFIKSNLYTSLPIIFGDAGTFATGCMYMEEDFESVVRFVPFPIGSYKIANDEKGRVRVFMRDFRMTVRQVVDKFARLPNGKINKEVLSEHILNLLEQGQLETWIEVCHTIMPNPEYKPGENQPSQFKKYTSCYYERSTQSSGTHSDSSSYDSKFLRESGYDYFPILTARWEVSEGDAYGTSCPGMDCLGDIKQLQHSEIRKAEAIDQKVRPTMVGPTSMRNAHATMIPGEITYTDEREGSRGFRRAFEMDFDIRELKESEFELRERINEAFFKNLFLMLSNSDRRQITATEIDERKEEKLLALGPVLEQLNQDLLDPLIDNTFYIMSKFNLIPEAPEEIQDMELKIEYVSIMAQAEKLAGIGGIDRFLASVNNMAQVNPAVLKKINFNEAVDIYGDLTGVPPKLVLSNEEVEEMEAAEREAAQREQQMMQAQQMIGGAKDLSQIKTDEKSALTDLMNQSQAGALV